MLGLSARLRRFPGTLIDQIFGTRDAAGLAAAVWTLPVEAVRCFHLELSVGALFGIELADGSRIALKVHQPKLGAAELEAQHVVQARLADNGFPCPRPILGPTPFLDRLATAEEWRTDGRRYASVTAERRRSMAAALVRIIEIGMELEPLPALEAYHWPETVWPEPHNALFDFRATRRGAEEIDEIGRRAVARMYTGRFVLAHQDWSIKHFRFRAGGEITVVYDWDSLSIDHESVAIGGAAASHTAAIPRRRWRPRLDDLLSFVDDYQAERPVGHELRRASLAYAVYRLAYTARCEHAIARTGARPLVTDVRSVLADFAAELLA